MKRLKFREQLGHSFMIYVSIIIGVILLLYLGGFLINFRLVIIGDNRVNNLAMSQVLEDQFEIYERESLELSSLPEMKQLLSGGGEKERAEVNRILYDFANKQDFKPYFALLDKAKNMVCSNFREVNQSSFASSPFAGSVISRLKSGGGKLLCFVCSAPLTSDQDCCYSFCRGVMDDNGNFLGYLFLNLRQEAFIDYSRELSQQILLTDTYNNIVFSTFDSQKDPMDKLPSGKCKIDLNTSGIMKLSDSWYYVYKSTTAKGNLTLYTLTSLEMQAKALWSSISFIILMLLILILIVNFLTRAFVKRNASELGELTVAVEALNNNNMHHELSPQASEETQEFYQRFKKLVMHNNELLERRRLMEVQQLEEQFNPHFVFNVMETVRYQIEEDPETASDMLLSFANLMRYSIDHHEAKVSIETDIQYVNDYLLLQKIRYNNLLHYEFHIPDELLECKIPKLMLQPIIENSIKHGYIPGQMLELSVNLERFGDDMRFTIKDNGAGISEERLKAINESFTLNLNSGFVHHIGLYNVQKMLSLLYGEKYGLKIDSEIGEGTCVVLTMPCETEEEIC